MKDPHRKVSAILTLALCVLATASVFAEQTAGTAAVEEGGSASELVEVDWFEEALEGGVTMLALAALSLATVAFGVQYVLQVRRSRIAPRHLAPAVLDALRERQPERALELAKRDPSVLSEVLLYQLEHTRTPPERVSEAVGDLAGRAISDFESRLTPFAVIAALAPLLGLLGTMIGMIESFKLVEVFGDEGGASMLAGSISKALITTATGLVIAIPAIILYHTFKRLLHKSALTLERESDRVFEVLFVQPAQARAASRKPTRDSTADRGTPKPAPAGAPARSSSAAPTKPRQAPAS